jgi:hypothetical protein
MKNTKNLEKIAKKKNEYEEPSNLNFRNMNTNVDQIS